MNRDIRRITDGAMMAAIIGVMLFIDRQTAGMISGGFVWILPIPMVFYSAKYGMKNSWRDPAVFCVIEGDRKKS